MTDGQRYELMAGDCLERMAEIADGSVDAIVTDPPYGLSFMGKRWDCDVPDVAVWSECLRVLKPGGHLLAFAGTRTQHRMCCRIEDGGFEIRDMLAWVYGSGFPKSLDVSKAIDKSAGAEREVTREGVTHGTSEFDVSGSRDRERRDSPATDAARQWNGWGTALKPAFEPITMARKPLCGTVADNVMVYGCGGINVDGCRVATDDTYAYPNGRGGKPIHGGGQDCNATAYNNPLGRFPANFIHDGSDEVDDLLGSAARFFYCAKAAKSDRGEGNVHSTVKPTDLMRYLCRLVTPPNGIVIDPFMGSGSTGKACGLERFRFIGIERDPTYYAIAERRVREAYDAVGSVLAI